MNSLQLEIEMLCIFSGSKKGKWRLGVSGETKYLQDVFFLALRRERGRRKSDYSLWNIRESGERTCRVCFMPKRQGLLGRVMAIWQVIFCRNETYIVTCNVEPFVCTIKIQLSMLVQYMCKTDSPIYYINFTLFCIYMYP